MSVSVLALRHSDVPVSGRDGGRDDGPDGCPEPPSSERRRPWSSTSPPLGGECSGRSPWPRCRCLRSRSR